MRKMVLLPEPEGPTSTTNSWSLTVRLRSCTTSTLPKYLLMCSKRTLAIVHASLFGHYAMVLGIQRHSTDLPEDLDKRDVALSREGWGHASHGGVYTPRLWMNASRSSPAHSSTIFPSATRYTSKASQRTRRPVAGIPMRSPFCVASTT